MKFKRVFTKKDKSVYDLFEWKVGSSQIKAEDGSVHSETASVEVPEIWEQVAIDTLCKKYLKRARVPSKTVRVAEDGIPEKYQRSVPTEDSEFGPETSLRQCVHRMVGAWTYWALKSGLVTDEEQADIFYDELAFMMMNQMWSPNSPQWFNTGLGWAYGIKHKDDGYFFFDHESGDIKVANQAVDESICRQQAHACVVGETMVLTSDGWLTVEEIVSMAAKDRPSQIWDGEVWADLIAAVKTGWRHTYRTTLKNGMYVDTTSDHKFLFSDAPGYRNRSSYRWEEAGTKEKNICGGRVLFSAYDGEYGFGSSEISEEEAEYVGFHIGDGYFGEYDYSTGVNSQFGVCCATSEEMKKFSELTDYIFGNHAIVKKGEVSDEYVIVKHHGVEQNRDFATRFDLGLGSRNLKVPKVIFQSGPDSQAAFLRGLFQADGSVTIREGGESNIRLTTASKELARDVQLLLSGLGIYSRINWNKDERENRAGTYQVVVAYGSARRIFEDKIGFSCGKKNSQLRKLNEAEHGRTKRIPSEEEVVSYECLMPNNVYDLQTSTGRFAANGIIVHNCFILGIEDSMFGDHSIYDQITSEAKIFKLGSGAGTNFSSLRGKGESLSGGGTSSGVMSFLNIFDRSADSVKSGGTSRRAAKMVSLDIDHPEIEDFINWKLREEQKVASLVSGSQTNSLLLNAIMGTWIELGEEASYEHESIKPLIVAAIQRNIEPNYIDRAIKLAQQGYTSMPFVRLDNDFNGEAYHTVSGQNSNNSIGISDDFMEAVKHNKKWKLYNRKDGSVSKEMNARDLWAQINYAAWSSADPGIHYHGLMNAWHTCSADGKIRATNPCSEYVFLDNTACNLASIRLTKFYDAEKKVFEIDKFLNAVRLVTVVLEMSVFAALLPTRSIAAGTRDYRTLGLGFADAGALVMQMCLPYDSDGARAVVSGIAALMTGQSYKVSAEMAKEIGAFNRFEANRESMLRVIRNHRAAAYDVPKEEYEGLTIKPVGLNIDECPEYLLQAVRQTWDQALSLGEQYGFRNAQVTVIAPTGTIGLVMSCDTTGIEPDFALVKMKKLAGGGYLVIINQSVPKALITLGYTEEQVDVVTKYITGHRSFKDAPHINHKTLRDRGFDDSHLEALEKSLNGVMRIDYVFNKYTLGEDFCQEILGFNLNQLVDPNFNMLLSMGFSQEQIEEANNYICGFRTIEGAPYVNEDDYSIFDCANKCGDYGQRYLPYEAHIKMMAAVQPFLSGGISKTINMDAEATIQDVENCYQLAYDSGLKCVAIYRDGCKLSQPLNARSTDIFSEIIDAVNVMEEHSDIQASPEEIHKAQRMRLPAQRYGVTHEFKIGPLPKEGDELDLRHKVFLRTGEYPDGRLGEIFIDYADEDSFARTVLGLAARITSVSLQYGVPLEEFCDIFMSINQEPSGSVEHDNVLQGKSIFDVIGKLLAYKYLGIEDVVHYTDEQVRKRKEKNGRNNVSKKNAPKSNGTTKGTIKLIKPSMKQCERCFSHRTAEISSCTTQCLDCHHVWGSCAA